MGPGAMILRPEVVRERLKHLHQVLRNLEETRSDRSPPA